MVNSDSKSQNWWILNIIISIGLSIGIITSSIYLGDKSFSIINAGNKHIVTQHYLQIQNPYPEYLNETIALDVKIDAPSLIALESYLKIDIALYANDTYRGEHNLTSLSNSNEEYYIVFEGSYNHNKTTPNQNFAIGYAYELPLYYSDEKNAFVGTSYPMYASEGMYDLLLGTGTALDAKFTSTETDFIKIRPVETLRELDLQKLGVYSTILSIAVATAVAIMVLLWTRR